VLLQQDGLDSPQVKQLGQEQPGGAAADDTDLGFHYRAHAQPFDQGILGVRRF
jgi:hypothetical protein